MWVWGGADKMYKDRGLGASGLVLIALAHALSLFAAVASSMNVSGGHVNPAVTFGALVGGRVSIIRALYYWVAQLLGSVLASLLLRISTHGMVIIILFFFYDDTTRVRNIDPFNMCIKIDDLQNNMTLNYNILKY